MNENRILSALIKSRKAWEQVKEHLDPKELGSDTAALLSLIQDYYERDGSALSVDTDVLIPSIGRQFPNPKHQKMLEQVVRTLPDTSPENVAAEILAVKRHNAGLKLSSALLRQGSPVELLKLYTDYGTLLSTTTLEGESEDDDVIEKFKVEDLVAKAFDPSKLIPLWPLALNNHIGGGLRPGHHVLIFGPVELGKSLLVINALAGWVEHKLRVLYVGNEDPVEDLMMRYICRLTQRTKAEVMAHPAKAQALLDKKGYENVIFAPLAPGTFETIDRLVGRFKPQVVVLDQLRNIDVDSENRTQALEKAATEARNLAKRCGLVVVSVSQAADSASGKRILQRGDVDSSNIGIPGQCDLMLGLGATEEDEGMNMRTLSFPKNKISGRHDHFSITIDPQLSMVVES